MVRKNSIKHFLWFLIIFILTIPLLQYHTSFFLEKPLNGHFEKEENPVFDKKDWLSGSWQNKYETFFKEDVGFRPVFVKTYNQTQQTVYNKINNNLFVVGDKNILYEKRGISPIYGEDFLGEDAIESKVKKIAFIKEKLNEEGKELLIVLAPNKARYFYDELPEKYKKRTTSNYSTYIKFFKRNNIDYIDFNQWFLDLKKEKEYNLIPKYGIHWGEYGSLLAADSIIKYCNKNYNYNLPTYEISSITADEIPIPPDYDMGNSLNLWFPLKEKYAHPKKQLKTEAAQKKSLLVISDSFFGNMFESEFSTDVFNLEGFWYYNKQVKKVGKIARDKQSDDLALTIPKIDIVVIMLTEWNMYRFGFGFVEELNSYYTGEMLENVDVRYYLERIRSDKAWFDKVKKQAIERKISLDSMLMINARYMAKTK